MLRYWLNRPKKVSVDFTLLDVNNKGEKSSLGFQIGDHLDANLFELGCQSPTSHHMKRQR
jgi:hypothetical protein